MSSVEHTPLDKLDKQRGFSVVKADRLTRICAALLRAVGASEEEVQAVATGCVNANLAGHDSHGVLLIPYYVDCIKAKDIVPGAEWTLVQESPTTAVIDGRWGFRQRRGLHGVPAKPCWTARRLFLDGS